MVDILSAICGRFDVLTIDLRHFEVLNQWQVWSFVNYIAIVDMIILFEIFSLNLDELGWKEWLDIIKWLNVKRGASAAEYIFCDVPSD